MAGDPRGRVEGVDEIRSRLGDSLVVSDILPIGSPRRDWKQTLVSDGFIMLRHPDWDRARELAFIAATDITMYAQ